MCSYSSTRRALAPAALLAACFALLAASSDAVLLLSASPPRGYNTFDAYGYAWLNASGVVSLSQTLAASPLFAAGYTTILGFSGWSQTPLANGSSVQHLDAFGRPAPAPERFPPGGMQAAAAAARAMGLRFGLWVIRGVHVDAVRARLPVKGAPGFTVDELVDASPTGGGANGSCLWDSDWLGVNASHPAAAAYYSSVVEGLVELGVDAIEADCFMCEPCYTAEMRLFTSAVRSRPESLLLYYSPGGGNSVADSALVAAEQRATMYRTITDFHGGWADWGGLQQAVFIAGNFTAARLANASNTWPDLDQIPMDAAWWRGDEEQQDRGQTIATLWVVGRYPLFSAGALPLDARTLAYLTNSVALAINARVEDAAAPAPAATRVLYEGNCTCTGGAGSCTIPHGPGVPRVAPCVAKWVAPVRPAAPAAAAAAAAGMPASNFTALAVINMGEDSAVTTTDFAVLGLSTLPSARWRVVDVWSGGDIGVFAGDAVFETRLRMHASALLQIVADA